MTDNTDLTPDEIKDLLDKKCTENSELEARIEELNQQITALRADKKRADIESRLAIEDAEMARSFNRKNYRELIEELIEEPLKRFHRSAYAMLLLVVIISICSVLFTVFFSQPAGKSNNTLAEISSALTKAQAPTKQTPTKQAPTEPTPTEQAQEQTQKQEAASAPQESESASQEVTEKVAEAPVSKQEQEPEQENKVEAVSEAKPEIKISEADAKVAATINRQSTAIVNFVRQAEAEGKAPQGYQSDKSKLIQLYLTSMQRALKESILYQSYLAAFDELGINSDIKLTAKDLAAIDTDFLRASYSGYLMTLSKKNRGWRYRDTDRRFSSYYNHTTDYNLGEWQIVNPSADYSKLPFIFAFNIQHIFNQLSVNKQKQALTVSDHIFYSAYPQRRKNQAVSILLSGAKTTNENNTLRIDASRIPLTLTNAAIHYVQKALADKGFMDANIINGKLGPKTSGAISAFRKSNDLGEGANIDLALLSKLGVIITYKDLLFEAPPKV